MSFSKSRFFLLKQLFGVSKEFLGIENSKTKVGPLKFVYIISLALLSI